MSAPVCIARRRAADATPAGRDPRTVFVNARTVPCPTCGAAEGADCKSAVIAPILAQALAAALPARGWLALAAAAVDQAAPPRGELQRRLSRIRDDIETVSAELEIDELYARANALPAGDLRAAVTALAETLERWSYRRSRGMSAQADDGIATARARVSELEARQPAEATP